MRLINTKWKHTIEFSEGNVTTLVIEDLQCFREYVTSLIQETRSKEGSFFTLSIDGIKPVEISDNIVLITDLFNLDFSLKTLTTALNSVVKNVLTNNYLDEIHRFAEYISELSFSVESYLPLQVKHKEEYTANDLVKILDFHCSSSEEDTLGQLVDYLNLHKKLLGINCCVLLNAFEVLDKNDLEALIHTCGLEKLSILFLESRIPEFELTGEKRIIIDKDLCEIFYS